MRKYVNDQEVGGTPPGGTRPHPPYLDVVGRECLRCSTFRSWDYYSESAKGNKGKVCRVCDPRLYWKNMREH